jgi:hypothetical protein
MGLRLKEIACVQIFVPQELERFAVQTVGAGLRHDIHDARIEPMEGRINPCATFNCTMAEIDTFNEASPRRLPATETPSTVKPIP